MEDFNYKNKDGRVVVFRHDEKPLPLKEFIVKMKGISEKLDNDALRKNLESKQNSPKKIF